MELWNQLIVNLSRTRATFFIVLDSIDDAQPESRRPFIQIIKKIQNMSNDDTPLQIKLLLTGRPKILDEISKSCGFSLPKVTLGVQNKDDILMYVDYRMD